MFPAAGINKLRCFDHVRTYRVSLTLTLVYCLVMYQRNHRANKAKQLIRLPL